MSWWPFSQWSLESAVNDAIEEYAMSPKFASQIQGALLQVLRDVPNDKELNFVGFINKIAITLYDAANGQMPYDEAKKQAMDIWRDFKSGERIEYGDKDYDWTGEGARILAYEFAIDYWD